MRLKNKKKLEVPSSMLKVGVVQMNSGEDVEANVAAAIGSLSQLKSESCDLVCFPENALFLRIDKKNKAPIFFNLKEKFWSAFTELSLEMNCHILLGSVPTLIGKKKYNSTVLVSPRKKPKIMYNKIHLFDVDVEGAPPSRESDVFNSGREPQILKIKNWNIGLSICYDVRFAELYSRYAKKNAHLLLVPSAFLVPTGEAHWHVLLRARAIESQCFLVAAAQSGGHTNSQGQRRDTFGHSLAVAPWGEVMLDLGSKGHSVGVIELDPSLLLKVRSQIPMAHHRKLVVK